MPNTDYAEKLRSYLKSAETAEFPFTTLAVQHLADGITTVQDSLGEFDTYFDPEKWEPTMPEIWSDDSLYPPRVKRASLGVLPGMGRVPAVRSFDVALAFAKQQLKPKNGAAWHDPLPAVQKEP
jgi:hypothetical protein